MIKYDDSLNGTNVPQDMIALADSSESRYKVIHEIVDLGEDKDGPWFRVVWDGLPDERDWTWHSAKTLYSDIPEMVLAYLSTCKKKNLVTKAKRQLGIST